MIGETMIWLTIYDGLSHSHANKETTRVLSLIKDSWNIFKKFKPDYIT